MEKEKSTKSQLIKAFDVSQTKSVTDLCKIVGVSRVTFYYHFNNDSAFRNTIFEKQRNYLLKKNPESGFIRSKVVKTN